MITALLPVLAVYAENFQPFSWGTHIVEVKEQLQKSGRVHEFTPDNNDSYKNKVMSFMTGMDPMAKDSIVILRQQKGSWSRDYLFYRDRLASIMEQHPALPRRNLDRIISWVTKHFSKPERDNRKKYYILSGKNSSSRMMLYVMNPEGRASKMKLYLYDRKLFVRMLSD